MGSKPPQPITSPTSTPTATLAPGVTSPFQMRPPIPSPPVNTGMTLTQPITSPMAAPYSFSPQGLTPTEHNMFTPPGLNPSGPATATPQNDPRAMALRNLFTPNRMGGR